MIDISLLHCHHNAGYSRFSAWIEQSNQFSNNSSITHNCTTSPCTQCRIWTFYFSGKIFCRSGFGGRNCTWLYINIKFKIFRRIFYAPGRRNVFPRCTPEFITVWTSHVCLWISGGGIFLVFKRRIKKLISQPGSYRLKHH